MDRGRLLVLAVSKPGTPGEARLDSDFSVREVFHRNVDFGVVTVRVERQPLLKQQARRRDVLEREGARCARLR